MKEKLNINEIKMIWECPDCLYGHDIKLEYNKPTVVECPNCEKSFYVQLSTITLTRKEK